MWCQQDLNISSLSLSFSRSLHVPFTFSLFFTFNKQVNIWTCNVSLSPLLLFVLFLSLSLSLSFLLSLLLLLSFVLPLSLPHSLPISHSFSHTHLYQAHSCYLWFTRRWTKTMSMSWEASCWVFYYAWGPCRANTSHLSSEALAHCNKLATYYVREQDRSELLHMYRACVSTPILN